MRKLLGGYEVFRGPMYQQGYGIGGYFRRFFKWVVPVAEKHALPHLKSGLSAIKNQALESVASIAKDTVAGRDVRAAVQEHVSQAIDNLKNKAEKTLSGEGKKRPKKILYKRRKFTHDI